MPPLFVWLTRMHSATHPVANQILDSTVGRVYYFNHDTQESTWEAPKEFQKGFFFTQAARKLLVVSVLSTVATNTLSAMRELSASPLLSTMGIVETCEPIVDPVTAVAVDDQPVNDAPCVEAVESQPIFSVDGATGLYAVDHLIVFADPDSGCPYYFDTLTGQSTWEEPPEVAAFKASNPHLFPEGFDENALCDTAMFEAEAEVAQLDADPTRHADFIGVVRCWRLCRSVVIVLGGCVAVCSQQAWETGSSSMTPSRSVVTIGIRMKGTRHGTPPMTSVSCGMHTQQGQRHRQPPRCCRNPA